MAKYLMIVLKKEGSPRTFEGVLLYQFTFHIFMHIPVCYLFYFLLLINCLLTCLRGSQGNLVPPIGLSSVNKVYLLTYLLTYKWYRSHDQDGRHAYLW